MAEAPPVDALPQQIEALETAHLSVTGEPVPFTPDVEPAFREAGIRADLDVWAAEAGFDVERLDCEEYPCLLVARPHEGVEVHEVHRALRDHDYRTSLPPALPDWLVTTLADPGVPTAAVRVQYRVQEALASLPGER